MNTAGKVFLFAASGLLLYEGLLQLSEFSERHRYYRMARAYCDRAGKPLLRVGMRRSALEPPNGDATLDIDPAVLKLPGGVQGDERAMPFEDKQFGVAFNEHTLEHLNSADDVERAIRECRRVADYACLLAPSANSIYGTLFCPSHRLRLWFDTAHNQVLVRPNTWRTGLGPKFEADTGGLRREVRQAMVTYEPLPMPLVIAGS